MAAWPIMLLIGWNCQKSSLSETTCAVYDFRPDCISPNLKNIFSTVAMKNQLSLLAQSDFDWPWAIGPVLKLQTAYLIIDIISW